MAEHNVNQGRRRFLTATTAVVGGVGAAFVAVPFVKSWQPSARAQAAGAPIQIDISKLQPGQRLVESWRGLPVWVFRRTPEMLEALPGLDGDLRDPQSENTDQQPVYAANEFRAIKAEIGVYVGICTHLGCSPSFVPELAPQPFDAQWKGGFFCPCHKSRFDLAGRVYQGVPAPTNLQVPPYRFVTDTLIEVGVDATEGAA
jgi:ubiquinol-cytochrome c reductase iron-sulfur subunit